MAERVLTVKIIGDSQSLQRSFARSGAAARRFDKDLGSATRGALAGSGVFRSLGRSLAFASGGFLAFASAGQFLRTSVDAAKEAAVTQAQLGAQFRASGLDLAVYEKQIDKTANRLSLLAGFENDEIKAGFTTIFRTTGNVAKALRDTATAADLARAKHLGFAQASLIIAKTEAHNTTLLRRQGFQIAKNATSEEALAKLRRIIAGQAEAGTTAQERFGAVLHNTEEIVGGALLPTLNRYLESGSKWLTQMNESGALQRDVARVTHDVARVFGDVAAVAKVVAGAFRGLNKITGSTEESVKDLGIAFLLLKARAKLLGLEGLGLGIAGIGAKAAVSTGQVGLLSGALLKLKGLGPIGVAVLLSFIPKAKPSTNPDDPSQNPVAKAFAGLPVVGGLFSQANKLGDTIAKKLGLSAGPAPKTLLPTAKEVADQIKKQNAFFVGKSPGVTGAATVDKQGRPLSLQGQFNLADLRLQQALLTKTTADDRVRLVIEAAITRQQILQTKTLKDRNQKTQQLVGILGQITGIDEANAQAAKAAADAAKEAAKAARERVKLALQAREFRVLNLDPSGQAFTPGVKALRSELGNVDKLIKGTSLDTTKNKGLLGRIDKLLFGKDAARLTKDVRSTVKQMLDGLNDELKSAGGPQTRFQKANTAKLLAGLGLSPEMFREARARLSRLQAGGTLPVGGSATPSGAFGGATIAVHHTTILDGRVLEKSVSSRQTKNARRNPPQRRGPHAGGGI